MWRPCWLSKTHSCVQLLQEHLHALLGTRAKHVQDMTICIRHASLQPIEEKLLVPYELQGEHAHLDCQIKMYAGGTYLRALLRTVLLCTGH